VKRELLLAQFERTPWAMLQDRVEAYAAVLHRWSAGSPATPEVMQRVAKDREAREARRASNAASAGGSIAVIPIMGVLTQRGNAMDDISGPGSTSTQMLSAVLAETLADEGVGGVLLDIDSPGGSVFGVGELADEIFQARGKKPIHAIANSMAASAAFWLGTQADHLYVTPGGEVGSVGVIMVHTDWSKWNETQGMKVTYITAGRYKSEGNPDEPLGAEAKAFEQSRVNDYYGMFVKAVARGRNTTVARVRDEMGEGRMYGAKDALANNMVCGIKTFDEAVRALRADMKQPRGPSSSQARTAIARDPNADPIAVAREQELLRIRLSSQG
jgi:signal peptide peptidase SppA